ncbi:uncharacterized protein LOC130694354 [Daphnia carinata]|uniref:uncharacterized protein LOC130694354 n=1 Tax=Daphnia carinata TaxID=120202 RepID=UPI00257A294B|nr:uncharacterized protein LOC130694354 [Daphnia carinata]
MSYFLLKNIIAMALVAFVFKATGVSAGSFGPCSGRRLDKLAKGQYMSPTKCVSKGGTCCGTDPSVRDHINDDPRTMDPNDRCYTCYNSDVSVSCHGNLIRIQPIRETERYVTSEKCKHVGGNCCMKSPTYAFNPHFISDSCDNCYSGDVSLPCKGKLLASSDYTAKTCASFGGRCCDQSPTGGDAFNPRVYPDPESLTCYYCYSGLPTIR